MVRAPEPWEREPDQIEMTCPKTGLLMFIARNPLGIYCGYARLPAHAANAKAAQFIADRIDVHGEVTWSRDHIKWRPRAEGEWWLGFDCAHGFDMIPAMESFFAKAGADGVLTAASPPLGTYRSVDYVLAECYAMTRQIAEVIKELS